MRKKRAIKTRASKSGKSPRMDLSRKAEAAGIRRMLRELPPETNPYTRKWVQGMKRHYKDRLKALQS